MKRNITLILITLCLAIGVVSCSEDSYPENPTPCFAYFGISLGSERNGLCGYPSVAGGWFVE